MGATHVCNIDDDEILTANLEEAVRERALALPPGSTMCLPWLSMWGGLDAYRADDSHWSRSQVDTVFADTPGMAYLVPADGYQHHARQPKGLTTTRSYPWKARDGGLMHLQFSSVRRLRAKQALYKINEMVRWPGRMTPEAINKMYDGTTYAPGLRVSTVNQSWWAGIESLRAMIDVDAEPWQEAEVKRLIAEHGRERFAGIDMYGIE
jgi:hypothetical protein